MKANDPDEFWKRIIKDDCWIWTGSVNGGGYGTYKGFGVHVTAYELLVGRVPKGKELHHKCRNRRCCNPDHLEALTRSKHRKLEPHTNGYEKKTHCPKGHPYDQENTGRYGHNRRHCKACARERYHRKREVTSL